jgi:hypothetical protein
MVLYYTVMYCFNTVLYCTEKRVVVVPAAAWSFDKSYIVFAWASIWPNLAGRASVSCAVRGASGGHGHGRALRWVPNFFETWHGRTQRFRGAQRGQRGPPSKRSKRLGFFTVPLGGGTTGPNGASFMPSHSILSIRHPVGRSARSKQHNQSMEAAITTSLVGQDEMESCTSRESTARDGRLSHDACRVIDRHSPLPSPQPGC